MTNQEINIIQFLTNIFSESNRGDYIQWIVITAILLIQAKVVLKGIKYQSKKESHLLPKYGIFGTFVGIVVALTFFDHNDITSSMPEFLASMKIVFFTSITGMLGSLILDTKVNDPLSEETNLTDVVHAIKTGDNAIINGITSINKNINHITNSISGTEEGSILNQLILVRSNMNDKFDSLNKEFRDFATLQAENNTKALVDAIREVIGDFNTKLNEQFGENFKELNNAVGDLVTWQNNYKDIIELTYKKIGMSSDSIKQSKEMLESVQRRFSENMNINIDVKNAIEVLTKENEKMIEKMQAFKHLSKTAEQAFPIIKENIEGITLGISKQVEQNLQNVESNMDKQHQRGISLLENIDHSMEKSFGEFDKSIHEINSTMNQSINELKDGVSKGIQSNVKAIEGSFKSINEMALGMISEVNTNVNTSLDTLRDGVGNINSSISDSVGNLTESIDGSSKMLSEKMFKTFSDSMSNVEQIQQKIGDQMESTILQIDDALRQELEKSLQSLGNQLASVSQKFVEDYTKLTNQMRIVVNQSDKFIN